MLKTAVIGILCVAMANGKPDPIHLLKADGKAGDSVSLPLESVTLVSQDNLNSRYHLGVVTHWEKNERPPLALVVSGKILPLRASGYSEGASRNYDLTIEPQDVHAVSAAFGIKAFTRSHPGHRLLTRFVPAKEFFAPGEEISMKLIVKNLGSEPVGFMVGGRNRGERDSQFSFSVIHDNKPLADIGNPVNFGGLAYLKTLKPGESFEKPVELAKWFKLSEPGVYTGTGTYALELMKDLNSPRLWDEVVAGEFYFQVKAK